MFLIKDSVLVTALVCAAGLTSQAVADDADLKIKWKGAPEISSADGAFKMKLRGRLYMDYGTVSVDGIDDSTVNGTEVRTARIGIEGVVASNVKYKMEVDFSGNEVTVKDAYIQYVFKPVNVLVGQFKQMNSLEEQTSSRYITFMERASFTDAFKLSRYVGIAVKTGGKNWTLGAGYFFEGFGSTNDSDNDTNVFAARGTFGPKFDNVQLHFGASYFNRSENGETYNHGYSQRPHNHQASKYVKSDKYDINSEKFVGLEFAAVAGPFSAQAEWAFMSNSSDVLVEAPSYSGGYFQVSYFVTGEKRVYKAKKGSFGNIKVTNSVGEGGSGAFEIAARYDVIDLTFNEDGEKQNTFLVGVNWHLNNYSRIMLNYSTSKVKDSTGTQTDSINAIGARFQIHW